MKFVTLLEMMKIVYQSGHIVMDRGALLIPAFNVIMICNTVRNDEDNLPAWAPRHGQWCTFGAVQARTPPLACPHTLAPALAR